LKYFVWVIVNFFVVNCLQNISKVNKAVGQTEFESCFIQLELFPKVIIWDRNDSKLMKFHAYQWPTSPTGYQLSAIFYVRWMNFQNCLLSAFAQTFKSCTDEMSLKCVLQRYNLLLKSMLVYLLGSCVR